MKSSFWDGAGSRAPVTLDPPRLADGGGNEYERLLVRSVRSDRVPIGAAEQVERALSEVFVPSAPPALESGGFAPRSAEVRAGGAGMRLGRLGMLGIGLVGAVLAGRSFVASPSGPASAATEPPAASVAVLPTATESSGAASAGVESPRVESGVPEPAGVAPGPAMFTMTPVVSPLVPRRSVDETGPARSHRPRANGPARATAPAPATARSPGLLEEVRALDRARAALDKGDGEAAARELSFYEQRFPRGELAIEAAVLAVDVALARGQRAMAGARARVLLAQPGAGRYASHLAAVASPITSLDKERAPVTSESRR
jgi:hypothetical protein